MRALLTLLGFALKYWFSRSFRDEIDLEGALEEEGEDGPTVRAILERRAR